MRAIYNIASPYGLAAIAYIFFIAACLLPPSTYSHYMGEPDLMFLDAPTILFYSLCVFSFVIGAWLFEYVFPSSYTSCTVVVKIPVNIFLLAPLVAGIALTIVSIALLMKSNANVAMLLLAQQGGDVKQNLAYEGGNFTFAPFTLIAAAWWAYWRSGNVDAQRLRKWPFRIALGLTLLLIIISAILTISRTLVMVATMGLAILIISRKAFEKTLHAKSIFRNGLIGILLITILFFGFSYLRGVESWDDQINQLLGYTVASYNRLAAVVHGVLHYPYSGHGVYISPFIAFNHSFNRIIPIASYLNWPEHGDVWFSEFQGVLNAGLDSRLIWSGAFGYLFSDLGWLAAVVVFGYGILAGITWRLLKKGATLGITLYPCVGFSILFWVGSNYLLDSDTFVILAVGIALLCYEKSLCKKTSDLTT